MSTVRSTEGLLFTNPGSAAKISLAEERRKADENYSFMGTPFQPDCRRKTPVFDIVPLPCSLQYRTADSRNTPSGVNKEFIRLNCKKSGASYQNENHCGNIPRLSSACLPFRQRDGICQQCGGIVSTHRRLAVY